MGSRMGRSVVVGWLVMVAGCTESSGDLSGPSTARVGETVTITSEGTLRGPPGEVSWIFLQAHDGGGVLDELSLVGIELDGGTELTDRAEPAEIDESGSSRSNRIYVRHDRRSVHYLATAEVTCLAPGEVVGSSSPELLYGLEWTYEDSDSAGCLDDCDFAFTCLE